VMALGKIKKQNRVVKTAPKMNLAVLGRTFGERTYSTIFRMPRPDLGLGMWLCQP
jgi:hypothetical protein